MPLLLLILAVLKVAQLLLVGAFAAGHAWCLTAFFVITGVACLVDLVLWVVVIITHREIDRREP